MRYIFILILLAAEFLCFGENPAQIRWLEQDYDFGVWKETTGPRTGRSRFVNAGREPISILDVRPSCGCTSATYTTTPIAPGDTATVTFTYDPTRRPGRFEKTVKVYLSDGTRRTIGISGSVIGEPESLRLLYPLSDGNLYMTPMEVPQSPVIHGRSTSYFVSVYNAGPDSVSPVAVSPSPGLRVERKDQKIGPGDFTTFGIYFDTRRHGVYGPTEVPVKFMLDEKHPERDTLSQTFRAVVLPDTDARNVANPDAPRLVHDFTNMDGNLLDISSTPLTFTMRLGNEGKLPLEIYRVYSEAPNISVDGKFPLTLKKGKHTEVKITVDTAKLLTDPKRQSLFILTNDPAHPVQEVVLVNKNQP